MNTMIMASWPAPLLRASKIVDNAWNMGFSKCTKLSTVLGDTVTSHVLGERGISLLGYGLGARAIYQCLMHLAERKMYGLIDSAVLMGAPIPGDAGTWSVLKSVVSGRLVNVYSPTDYILAFASRQTAYMFSLAGLGQIQGVGGVENHNVADIVNAHLEYPAAIPHILKRIGWDDIKNEFKDPPPQPNIAISGSQKTSMATGRRHGPNIGQSQGRTGTSESKENSQPQRGGRNSRGSFRGSRGGRSNSTADRRLTDQMGKMYL